MLRTMLAAFAVCAVATVDAFVPSAPLLAVPRAGAAPALRGVPAVGRARAAARASLRGVRGGPLQLQALFGIGENIKKVGVVGATGGVGRLAVAYLLEKGARCAPLRLLPARGGRVWAAFVVPAADVITVRARRSTRHAQDTPCAPLSAARTAPRSCSRPISSSSSATPATRRSATVLPSPVLCAAPVTRAAMHRCSIAADRRLRPSLPLLQLALLPFPGAAHVPLVLPRARAGLTAAIAGVDALIVASGTTAFPTDKWGPNQVVQ